MCTEIGSILVGGGAQLGNKNKHKQDAYPAKKVHEEVLI